MAVGLAGAGLALTAYGTYKQYGAAKDAKAAEGAANAARQKLLDMQAKDIIKQGKDTADLIYRKAYQARSTQVSQQAASGVLVGDGSASAVENETSYLARADALAELAQSEERANQVRAGAFYDAAASAGRQSSYSNQATAALINGAASSVSIAGDYYYREKGGSNAIKVNE